MSKWWVAVAWALCPLAASAADDWQPGAQVRIYDVGAFLELTPDIAPGQAPNLAKVVPAIDLTDQRHDFGELKQNFVVQVRARLKVPAEGWYTFRLTSDDGSLMWLNDQLVIDHDGLHGAVPRDASVLTRT